MACSNSGVLRTSYNQLTGSQRTALLAEATAYRSGTVITNTSQFKSNTQYLAYIKAKTIAQSTNGPGPVPSVIITDLQETYRLTPPISYPSTYNVLTSPSTSRIDASGQGIIFDVYWKVCDISSSLFAAIPRLNAVHQITSVSLSYYSGFTFGTGVSSDAQFSVERDSDPALNTIVFFTAERKRVVPAQLGNSHAIGSPPHPEVGGNPLTYRNASYTITDQSVLQAMFGNGTDTIDKTKGLQFYWFSSDPIRNSQFNEFIINYTYSICRDVPFSVPGVPTNVQIVSTGDGFVIVSWVAPFNDGGSPIVYYIVTASQFSPLFRVLRPRISAITAQGFSPLKVTGLTNDVAYTFTVVAVSAGGSSQPSDPSEPATPASIPLPPPTDVTAYFDTVNYPGFMFISWTAPTDTGGFTIFRYRIDPIGDGPISTDTTYSTPYLTPGVEYSFIITAIFNEGGESPSSEPSAPPILFGPARPPTDVSASLVDISEVLVNWTLPVTNGGYPISSYTVTLEPGTITQTVYGATTTSAVIPNFTFGVTYTITVVATNQIGDSAESLPVSFSYGTVPDAPTDVSGIAGNEFVTVSWTAPVNDGGYAITSYTVEDIGAGVSQDVSGDVTETTITGLTNGETYSFTVTATNFAGTSDPSEGVSLMPTSTVGTAPTGVTAYFDSANSPGVTFISWTAPTDTGGLTIFRYRIDTVGFSFNSESTTFSTTFLTPGLEYSFTVTATFVEGGESPPSDPSEYILFGAARPPTAVTAGVSDTSTILVNWTPPVTDGGYPILYYTVNIEPGTITQSTDGPVTGLLVSGCTLGVTYTFTVVAGNGVLDSEPSEPLSYLFITRPNPPTGVFANLDAPLQVSVSWTPPVFDGGSAIEKYRVISIPSAVVQETGDSEPSILLNFPPMPPNNYSFIVLTITTGGESLPSNPSNQITV